MVSMMSNPTPNAPLILFAHPHFEQSHTHKRLLTQLSTIEGCVIHDLYECYPNFFIDIQAEQQALLAHELIILQFPVHWFGMPALLKQWIDTVLQSGFAYGNNGSELQGKKLLCIVSTGASEADYAADKPLNFNIKQLFAPIEHMTRYCHMQYLPPYVVYDAHQQKDTQKQQHKNNLQWLMHNIEHADDRSLQDYVDINSWLQTQQEQN